MKQKLTELKDKMENSTIIADQYLLSIMDRTNGQNYQQGNKS